ncbi:MAG TPA: mannitol dehydrogenase family protein [Mycobacteriales bacterium]|nr:mannitol dehydrogenase family protein [Mycobacteriales bacterium]
MSGAARTPSPLSRRAGDGRESAPVRQVHLGLGGFFRAHQAWYTEHCPDRDEWGIAAFTGRSRDLADTLTGQDSLYTLVTRSPSEDRFEVVSSLSACYRGSDQETFRARLASAQVRLLTLTITEAGYRREATGLASVPDRLVAALAARRAADAGPITLVPCDNLPGNGGVLARVIAELAGEIDPALADWIEESVSFVDTVVDRITPRLDPADLALVAAATGRADRAPVVTEPFSEWVLRGSFPAGRPAWDHAGARFTDSIEPFEQRKLWLLNGGHSLLAYAGSLRGHRTVADAVADETCLGWLDEWWQEAAAHLELPDTEIADYRAALLDRFGNHRIRHQLAQIAADGSQKLPVRVVPVVLAERALGRSSVGGLRVIAGWLCHLRGAGVPISDPRAAELTELVRGPLGSAASRLLRWLDPALGDDAVVVSTVTELAAGLST